MGWQRKHQLLLLTRCIPHANPKMDAFIVAIQFSAQ
jgi:hypothetical protein